MRFLIKKIFIIFVLFGAFGCQDTKTGFSFKTNLKSDILYAKNLDIYTQKDFSIVVISNPWQGANKDLVYILKKSKAAIPDSLQHYPCIQLPINSIVVSSTTSIPMLESLAVIDKLVGFPNTNLISSPQTRKRIDLGAIQNLGQNESINVEKTIALSPDLILGFGVESSNSGLLKIQNSGLPILVEADWTEQTPLGKAEWIKLYGQLFDKNVEAKNIFDNLVVAYQSTQKFVANSQPKTLFCGAMYQDIWYVPKGNSFVAQLMLDAQADYLWKETKGTGSLGLPFETVFEKAKHAQKWIVSGAFQSLDALSDSNPHYQHFDAFKKQEIYTFDNKIGATGGSIFYEMAVLKPQWVLMDYIKIVHPESLPDYQFTFAEKLH
jgi:iron complex transport system substrate-binding protein